MSIAAPIYSSWPQCLEWAVHMSLYSVVKKSTHGIQEAYNEYIRSGDLRLGIERVRENDENLDRWLRTWQNCWTGQHLGLETAMSTEEGIQESSQATEEGPHDLPDQMARRTTAAASTHMLEMLGAWRKNLARGGQLCNISSLIFLS